MDWEERTTAASRLPEGVGDSIADGKAKAKAVRRPPDRMVKIEMEAAEALADLAQLAARENGSGSGSSSAEKVAGRPRKRVETESSLSRSAFNPVDSSPSRSDLAQDSAVWSPQQHEKPLNVSTGNHLKSEPHPQPSEPSHISTTGHLLLGGRSRQNLSEAEKEVKRLRRVLANRESARRTIRRRQALCEELSRKAAELTEENEKLQEGKEAALREVQMLEARNKQLKQKMAKAMKSEVVATTTEIMPASGETPASPINFPMLLHNNPLAPLLWPPIFQSPSTGHQVPPSLPFIPANVTTQASFKPELAREHNPQNIPGPRTPVYILPCPWFFTLPNQVHHSESSENPKSDRDEKTVDNQQGATSTQTTVISRVCGSVLPASAETEAPGPSKNGLSDLNEIPIEFPVDQGSWEEGIQCEEAAIEPKQATSIGAETVRHESKLRPDPVDGVNVVDGPAPTALTALPEKEHRDSVAGSIDIKAVTGNAAVEARRRRKELTKLKAMHGRPYRLHC